MHTDMPIASEERANILVVDDLDDKLLVYRTILEELGQNVVTARSGEEALAHLLRTEFAVILLDVQMPGMDGFETAEMIRRRRKSMHTPIIFLTAFTDEVRTATGYAHGAVDYIATPVVPEVLRAKVRVFVDLHRMTQRVLKQAEERVALAEERTRRTSAEDANRRLALLARAGAVLGRSLDPMETAADVIKLAVPALAEEAHLVLLSRPGAADWTVLSSGSEVRTGARDQLDPARAAAIEMLFAGETPEFKPHEALLGLQAHGTLFGVLALVNPPGFEASDRTVAEALVARAAIAIENGRLYQSVQAADRQKNDFLSMLAHELRNPLAPILNAAEILRLAAPDHQQVQWARTIITRQMNHLVRLVDDLLDISRITSGKIRLVTAPVNLEEVFDDAVEASRPMMERFGHTLQVTPPAEAVWVNGDAARLIQVFTNLLNNAAKYTDPGGRITVTAEREADSVAIRVRDTGIGLPADKLDSIFDLFTQVGAPQERSQGGLGIGLSLVRRLVTKHGGTVAAFSEGLGRGSEFVVRLPTIPVPTSEAAKLTPAPADLKMLDVLLVDDNVDGAGTLATVLRSFCRTVYVAHRGETGLELAREHRPDAIILDINLPGMSGYDLARELRARPDTRGAALIALTGHGRKHDVRQSREAGFDRHLVKPVSAAELRLVLESLLRRS
jgi:signal transduction histidine kinase/CheY-like chemotaxis protein